MWMWTGLPGEVLLELKDQHKETIRGTGQTFLVKNSVGKGPEAGRSKALWSNRKTVVTGAQKETLV